MAGNMLPASNVPGGRYDATDDRTRSSQTLYGTDDEPQIVASAIITPGDPPVLSYAQNVRSVSPAGGVDGILVELDPMQPHADYVVTLAWQKVGDSPSHLLVSNRTPTQFEIFARYGNGAVYPLGDVSSDQVLVVQVRKAL